MLLRPYIIIPAFLFSALAAYLYIDDETPAHPVDAEHINGQTHSPASKHQNIKTINDLVVFSESHPKLSFNSKSQMKKVSQQVLNEFLSHNSEPLKDLHFSDIPPTHEYDLRDSQTLLVPELSEESINQDSLNIQALHLLSNLESGMLDTLFLEYQNNHNALLHDMGLSLNCDQQPCSLTVQHGALLNALSTQGLKFNDEILALNDFPIKSFRNLNDIKQALHNNPTSLDILLKRNQTEGSESKLLTINKS